ncbi:MAG: hypothetical protein ACOX3W_06765 [Christensenellaceae bacterium]|jgi:hypothetical protein
MKINVAGFIDSLGIMLYGMIGIIVVMCVLYATVALLTGLFTRKKKPKSE